MTVSDLIKSLERFPQGAQVLCDVNPKEFPADWKENYRGYDWREVVGTDNAHVATDNPDASIFILHISHDSAGTG